MTVSAGLNAGYVLAERVGWGRVDGEGWMGSPTGSQHIGVSGLSNFLLNGF